MSTAFVLTGGGSLGAVQVGMLAALHESGVQPDLLVGTSVGALNAAHLAGPGSPGERLDALTRLWERVRRRDVLATRPSRWLAAAVGAAPSLFAADRLREVVERHLGYEELDQARVPVHVVATDLVTGRGTVITTGSVSRAVLASAAVPGLLPAVVVEGRGLVDGAIGDVDAVRHAVRWGADDVYLLPAGYPCLGRTPATALESSLTALSVLLHRQLLTQVRRHDGPGRLHVMPPLCPLSVSPADFHHGSRLLRRSHEASARWLARSLDLAPPEEGLAFHDHGPAAAQGRVRGVGAPSPRR